MIVVVRTDNSSRKIWLWGGAEREREKCVCGAGRVFNYRRNLLIMCSCQWRKPRLGG